ncbi:MAG: sigma-E factor negative regulatory protein [Burkholderiaceae bacterium]|jgi:sigma-E factor negative regulatory protein RseA
MSQPDNDRSISGPHESSRRILSALADGDATDSEAARAFQSWRDEPDARESWHAYQLIGDVLRSEDLATEPAADESFLVALRARLAIEPVVLAPQPRVEVEFEVRSAAGANAPARSRRWQGPVAMAAGFLAVIGVLNVAGPFKHGVGGSLASNATSASGPVLASTTSIDNSGVVLTSAQSKAAAEQLAPYLAAHRQSAMNGPFQMPGSDLRNASLVQPAR